MNVLPMEKQIQIVTALVEGNSVRATARMIGVEHKTVMRGVMAYAVGQRESEIGVRIALGVSTGSVLRLILGQGLALAGLGLASGLAVAVGSTWLLRTMLFQVRPNDPLAYLAVTVLLSVVALVASYVPARRACKIDPLVALRQE